jgi:hypothetical protein
VKKTSFEQMDPLLKSQYEFLAQHLLAQSQFQKPIMINGAALGGKMFALGWRKAYAENEIMGKPGIISKIKNDIDGYIKLQEDVPKINSFLAERFRAVSPPVFDKIKQQHQQLSAPSLDGYFQPDPNGFTSNLSFTYDNFFNKPHKDSDGTPYSIVMWIPIDKKTGKLVENDLQVKGGNFLLPEDGCGIDFNGFNGIVECAWKATTHLHYTLPSSTPSTSSHTRLGLSCQVPRKSLIALKKIQAHFYEGQEDWFFRDLDHIVMEAEKELVADKNKKTKTIQQKEKKQKL